MATMQHTVLCVDDEQNILNALKRLLRKERFTLLTTTSGREGLKLLAQNDVQVVISDQRMPEMNGTDFLKEVKELYPETIRIILTGYTDVDTISNSINAGHIYKFFLKPWNDQQLTLEIRQALEQFDLMQANKQLHDMTMRQNQELKTINENLEHIVAERTSSLELQNRALLLSQAILEELPYPIIGISAEMGIALINNAAKKYFSAERDLQVGEHISCLFSDNAGNDLQNEFTAEKKQRLTFTGVDSGRMYQLLSLPLTGRFHKGGFILTPAEYDRPSP